MKIAEKKEISMSRSRSHSKSGTDVSPHHRRTNISPSRNHEQVLSSNDLGYKVVNESSYIDPSNNEASMSSIYKRL